ncbi:TPA: sugar ABC transporter ATP-binding protein [Klebsiella quasipneumoniae subsp. similipneumoniae]|nr:sugar ABC transporter ATP-binding protein [Klebsiella quasipneumoniae subsp. similipneumoniae]
MNDKVSLSLRNITKTFGNVNVLSNVNLEIRENEVIGLIGENGAGKSTLLKILSGSYQPDAGEIYVAGQKTILSDPSFAATKGISVVHQEQSLITNLSVAENILMSVRANLAGKGGDSVRGGIYNWKKINDDAARALKRIGSNINPRDRVSDLSFAERQMVEIAKALQVTVQTNTQPIIVLDEPTSVLEGDDILKLEGEVKRLKAMGSVVFVSHRLDEILRFSDRIYVLRNGEVVGEVETSLVNEDDLFKLMTGRSAEGDKRKTGHSVDCGQTVLTTENLTLKGKFSAVNLAVRQGEVHAIIGTNNSGREEFCRTIFGIEKADSGRVLFQDNSISSSLKKNIFNGIAYLPSERKSEAMIAGMTVAENIVLTHPGSSTFKGVNVSSKRKSICEKWISKLGIRPNNPDADIGNLSGGNQQKAVLAKWLEDPRLSLLILDHPTRGIDPGAREDVTSQILEVCARGTAVLLIADTLEEALSIADTITVMRDGEITATYDLTIGVLPTHAELVGHMI